MKQKQSDSTEKQGHSQVKHMWMMAICCGLPIVGFLAISALEISATSLETLIALICPIGMVGMMYMMNRDSQRKEGGHICCHSEQMEKKEEKGIGDDAKGAGEAPVRLEQPGIFRA